METENLIKEELTEEQKKLLEEDENKKKYKALQIYIQSEDFKKTCEKLKKRGEEMKKDIEEMIEKRMDSETKSTKSQLDKDIVLKNTLDIFIKNLKNSDGEQILKDFFKEQIEAIDTHIFDKISNENGLYDVPFYTNVDLHKQMRVDLICFEKRVKAITASFAKVKEETDNPNPYEA